MSPGQIWQTGRGGDQVEEGPGDDDAVVDVEPEDDGHGGVSHPLEDGDQLSHHGTASSPEILSSSNFLHKRRSDTVHYKTLHLEEYRNPAGEHRNEVDEKEGACKGEIQTFYDPFY